VSLKGAGGRYQDDDQFVEQPRERPASPLSVFELICFCIVIFLLFWFADQIASRGRGGALFRGIRQDWHVFGALSVALCAYAFSLAGTNVPRTARLAGAMLASTVSVSLLYLLLYISHNLYLAGAGIALGGGASLCSRCGLPREAGYPAGLIAAAVILIAYTAATSAVR
jgi:hypothetical protein